MAARCFNPIMAVFAHRKGALHIAANCENLRHHEQRRAYGSEARGRLTLRWRTVAAVRHNMAWRRIWFCLCLCLCRCLDLCASAASVVLCPPLLFCVALSLFASQPLSLQDVSSGRTNGGGSRGNDPQRAESEGRMGARRGRPGGGRGGGHRGRPPENVGGRRPARGRGRQGAGKTTTAGQHPRLGKER